MKSPEPHDPVAGTRVGDRYTIERLIGRGGMASVYRARDDVLGRMVAIKVFRAEAGDSESLRRKTSEIHLLASLNHHSLVTLYDASIDATVSDSGAYIVMELVDGSTLTERIGTGPIEPREVAAMAADLAEGLHVVHSNGVVHRDIKPGNVLLGMSPSPHREFRAKLADFGIAYLIDSARLTTPGVMIGTAAYVSPEQTHGAAPDPSMDIYSLGLVLLESLVRERAFPGSLMESVSARLERDPRIPDRLGAGWTSLLAAMTDRQPENRPTALEVVAAARALERDDRDESAEAPTKVFPVAATEVLPRPAPAAVTAVPQGRPAAAPRPRRDNGALWTVLAVLASLIVAGVAVALLVSATAGAPPALPQLDDPLGQHLRELLEAVRS